VATQFWKLGTGFPNGASDYRIRSRHFAYRQVVAYSMFELLKYTADEDARLARAKVITELSRKSYEESKNDREAIKAAGRVCAYYNIMARVLQVGLGSNRKFFIRPLAPGISLPNYVGQLHVALPGGRANFARTGAGLKDAREISRCGCRDGR
jgi:hypothetical protein